jgi:hypothetical protein
VPFARAHTRLTAAAVLSAVATLSIALRIHFAAQIHGPFVFMDELGYAEMAKTFARTGHIGLFGKSGLAYSPLYPILVSPVYALASSAQTAYEWAKVENSVLMSLAAFPVYGIARFVLSRPRAVGVAALSLAAPLMFYTGLEMSESLAYPVVLVAVWAMLRALGDPGMRNDALLLGAVLLACATRLQEVALFPAALTAVLLVALFRPTADQTRLRSALSAVARHRLLFGSVGLLVVAALARTVANGGALPLAGRYANVGSARANPLRVLEIAGQHLAELDFAIGLIPFAGALLAGYALARHGFPHRGLVFGSVAVATTIWIFLEVAFDAAAYDRGTFTPGTNKVVGDLPRIHERYLIYLVPFFLVALVAALRQPRPRVRGRLVVAVAVVAALLPAAIPFSSVVNYTIVADSFGLQIFGTDVGGRIGPISHPLAVALVAGSIFGLAFVYALARPRPSFAIVMTVVAFVILGSLVRIRLIGGATPATLKDRQARTAWVDRAVGASSQVALVGGPNTNVLTLEHTAFANLSIDRVYYACNEAFGAGFGELQVALDANGTLRAGATAVRTTYALVPAAFHVSGRVLGRDRKGGLELVAPTGGLLRVPVPHRRAAVCSS